MCALASMDELMCALASVDELMCALACVDKLMCALACVDELHFHLVIQVQTTPQKEAHDAHTGTYGTLCLI